MNGWICRCGWRGPEPSMSDASVEKVLPNGEVIIDRTHLPICPVCFTVVCREQAQRRR